MTPLVLLPQQLFKLQSLSVIKKKTNVPICSLENETKGPALSKHSSHFVLIPIIKLAVVDGAGLRQKLGISFFIETASVAKLLSW